MTIQARLARKVVLAGSFAFGPARSPPVVTYGAWPRGQQNVRPVDAEKDRNLVRNVAGIVTPAAAITLGIIAFASSTAPERSATPESSTPADAFEPTPNRAPILVERVPQAVTIPVESVAVARTVEGVPEDAQPARIAAVEPRGREIGQAAVTQAGQLQMVARPDPIASSRGADPVAGELIPPFAPTALPESRSSLAFANAVKAKEVLGANNEASLVTGQPLIELEIERASETQTLDAEVEYVRRDYSQTVKIAGVARDIPIPDSEVQSLHAAREPFQPDLQKVGEMREKISALKNAHPRVDYARNTEPRGQDSPASATSHSVTGTIAPDDVIVSDGKLSWVRLGALLDVVEAGMPPDRFAVLASSNTAGAFVSTATLHRAGLEASYDGKQAELTLSLSG